MRVRDGEIKTVRDAGHRVAVRNGIFADVVDDQRAGIVGLRLVGPLRLPLRGGRHDEIGYRSIIRIERKRDRPGTNAILILRIVPDLFRFDRDGDRTVVEGNRRHVRVVRGVVVAGFRGHDAGNRKFVVRTGGVGERHHEIGRERFARREIGKIPHLGFRPRPCAVGGLRHGVRERDAPRRGGTDVLDLERKRGGIATADIFDERRIRCDRELQIRAGRDTLRLEKNGGVDRRPFAVGNHDFDRIHLAWNGVRHDSARPNDHPVELHRDGRLLKIVRRVRRKDRQRLIGHDIRNEVFAVHERINSPDRHRIAGRQQRNVVRERINIIHENPFFDEKREAVVITSIR